ncbi:MAG: flagellar protein FlgN [Gemmatimonadaceae bacterium]|jgi:hypothetical protein|nr:flagellar protein FlgN [Gemmatimonadaceae bacterium]
MPYTQPIAPVHSRASSPADVLVDVLRSERRLLEELVAVMQRQRAAVAADDLQALDDSVFATYRVLATLGEARRRRRSVNRLFGREEDFDMNDLEVALGTQFTPALREARDTLRDCAAALATEVARNKQVLEEAMARGKDYVSALVGAASPVPAAPYVATGAPAAAPRRIVDRSA